MALIDTSKITLIQVSDDTIICVHDYNLKRLRENGFIDGRGCFIKPLIFLGPITALPKGHLWADECVWCEITPITTDRFTGVLKWPRHDFKVEESDIDDVIQKLNAEIRTRLTNLFNAWTDAFTQAKPIRQENDNGADR